MFKNWKHFIPVSLLSLLLLALLYGYTQLRGGSVDKFALNRLFAAVCAILAFIVLLIGPFSRLFDRFDKYLSYRKEVGVIAFVYGLLHTLLTIFFLPERYSLAGLLERNALATVLGLVAIISMAILFIFSFEKIIGLLNRKYWWYLQNWGMRIAGIAVFFHFVVLKWSGWLEWYRYENISRLASPFLPALSLLIAGLGFYVILVRLTELINKSLAKFTSKIGFIVYVLFVTGTILWGVKNWTAA